MSVLNRRVKKLLRKNSQKHVVFLFFSLIAFFLLAIAARYYALAPVQIQDASMSPLFAKNSVHFMCKLPLCTKNLSESDIVWVKLKNGETIVRKVIATPGKIFEITDKGQVRTAKKHYKWKGENAFIQSRKIYVPKNNDTLIFKNLNDVEQDYAISYMQARGQKLIVKSTLWQGERKIPIDRVGSTKIANRQTSVNEINFLPWQDRYLIELQIKQSEPSNEPIKIKRQIFAENLSKQNLQPSDTLANDSTKSLQPEQISNAPEISIDSILISDDCYFLACVKGESCLDSREMGYFTKQNIIGKYIEFPDNIFNKIKQLMRLLMFS